MSTASSRIKSTPGRKSRSTTPKIGDTVIALEQQAAWSLVHIDSAFDVFCEATGRNHKKVESLRAIEGSKPEMAA
jgi:hypothetical protein